MPPKSGSIDHQKKSSSTNTIGPEKVEMAKVSRSDEEIKQKKVPIYFDLSPQPSRKPEKIYQATTSLNR
jgi:hypothetical protein